VAARFPADSITRALLQDLASKEEQVPLRAATTLGQFEKLPADSGPLVERAMQIHLTAELKKRIRQTNLLIQLAILAGNLGSDQAMSAVLALADSNLDSQTRGRAINQLGRFKQEQAAKALRGFLRDMNDDVRFEAARTLANRKDPAAMDELLAVAADKQNRWRAYAYLSLANFPSDARAKEAIEKGLDDPEDFARSQAQQALRELRRNQKK
jgi:HEAT repeat protein